MPEFKAIATLTLTDEYEGHASHRVHSIIYQACKDPSTGIRLRSVEVMRLVDLERESYELRDRVLKLENENRDLVLYKRESESLKQKHERAEERRAKRKEHGRKRGVYLDQDRYWTCAHCEAWNSRLKDLQHAPWCPA